MTQVIYYKTEDGENPVKIFITSLSSLQKSKLARVITYIEDYGATSAIPHLKKLIGTSLWEIRILGKDNIRVLYFIPSGDSVLFLHGFIKKTQKTPAREINMAITRLNDFLVRQKRSQTK